MKRSLPFVLLSVLLCAYMGASELGAAGVTTKVVSRGRAPAGEFGYWFMRAVALTGWKHQLLAVPTRRTISFLRVRDTRLEQVDYIQLHDTAFAFAISPGSAMHGRTAFWTSGDVDSDAGDELLIALDTLLLIYRRVNPIFVPETVALPRPARQLVVGDIDNDGRNEIIACCDTTTNGRWREGYPDMKYRVYVCRYVGRKLEVLWDDQARLGYGEPEMPDYFWSVADFQNIGHNQLLVTRSQSDVSPTVYDLLEWDGRAKHLRRRTSFLVSDTIVPASSRVWDPYPYALGRMLPLRTSRGMVLMVEFDDTDTSGSGDDGTVFRQRLLRIKGGTMQTLGDVRYRDYPSCSNYYATIDPDGIGPGVLRACDVWRPQPGKCFYEFRRLVFNQVNSGQ
jgi:hypothetical protein